MKTRFFSILLFCLALSWPALRNGGPFVMSDTTTYVRGADAAVYKLTGMRTMWTGTFIERYETYRPHEGRSAPSPAAAADAADLPVTIAGRSIFYGILLYLSSLTGSFWGAALFQIVLTATAIRLAAETCCRLFGRADPGPGGVALIAFVLGLSPAGYFAGYMMPDIFLPLAILAFCQVALLWRMMNRAERIFWIALLTMSGLFHSLHLVILLAAFAVLFAVKRAAFWREDRQPATAIAAAIIIGFVGQAGFGMMVRQATGAAPVTIPFVTARLIADGPGRDYLRAHCVPPSFHLCHYAGRLQGDSDSFLWSYDPRLGIFSATTPRERRQLSAEQAAFVIAVTRDRPWAVVRSTIVSILRQSGKWRLPEFNYGPAIREHFRMKLPDPALDDVKRSAAYRQVMPVRFVEVMTPLLVIGAIGLMVMTFRRMSAAGRRMILPYVAIVVAMLVLNIILCGGVSTPHDRYQMRLIWLLPLLSAMLWSATSPSREAGPK